jgi:hypothetical protein
VDRGRHHFVPRFYLKAFACAPKRIHVFNLDRRRAFLNASLKGQCYKRDLHAPLAGLEEGLANFENDVAPAIREILATGRPPARNSPAMRLLIAFISLQQRRTAAAIAAVTEETQQMVEAVGPFSPEMQRQGWGRPIRPAEAIKISFAPIPELLRALLDLHVRVLVAGTGARFVTSDNPVFIYNQYCEGVRDTGVLGIAQSGVQIFCPLSPSVAVMMFDAGVYRVGAKSSDVIVCEDPSDMEVLNGLQVLSAGRSVLFSDARDEPRIARLVERYAPHRVSKGVHTEVFERVDDPSHGLTHSFQRAPNVRLDLSFCALRRRARRVPLLERAQLYRRNAAIPEGWSPPPPEASGEYRPRPANRGGVAVRVEAPIGTRPKAR